MKNFGFGNYKFFVAAMSVASFSFAATYAPPSTAVSKINSYRGYSELTSAASGMDIDQYTYNMTTWQIANGGFYKAMADKYKSAYGGGQKSEWRAQGGADLGTIDNNATIQEMRLLAVRYKETTNSSYKAAFKTSFNKCADCRTYSCRQRRCWLSTRREAHGVRLKLSASRSLLSGIRDGWRL